MVKEVWRGRRGEGRPLSAEAHEALKSTLRRRSLCVEHYHALKVGMRWCIEEWPRGPCVRRLSGDEALGNCDTQNRGYALLKPSTEGMR